MGRSALGEFEQLVLLACLRLGDGAYGVAIIDEIGARTGREVSQAAVYVALGRLEDKGLLTSKFGEPTPERGGRAKRFYRVTEPAIAQLRESRAALVAMWEDLEVITG